MFRARVACRAHGGLGIVAELGAVESADVARVLAVVLGSRILDVVVKSDQTITWMLGQQLPATNCLAIALSNARWKGSHFKDGVVSDPQHLLKLPTYSEANGYPGCLGYLVNLYIHASNPCQNPRRCAYCACSRAGLCSSLTPRSSSAPSSGGLCCAMRFFS